MDQDIEDRVRRCAGCEETRSERPSVFLHPWKHTNNPYERVHLDVAGPMSGRYYLVLVDSHSKWPELVPMKEITSGATIRELTSIFARFGIPWYQTTDHSSHPRRKPHAKTGNKACQEWHHAVLSLTDWQSESSRPLNTA